MGSNQPFERYLSLKMQENDLFLRGKSFEISIIGDKKRTVRMRKNRILTGLLAEAVGFEPTSPAKDYLISSQARYDHFDTLPYLVVQKSSFNGKKRLLKNARKSRKKKR